MEVGADMCALGAVANGNCFVVFDVPICIYVIFGMVWAGNGILQLEMMHDGRNVRGMRARRARRRIVTGHHQIILDPITIQCEIHSGVQTLCS